MWLHNNKDVVVEELQVYARWISACNSERMVEIGAELPKLSQKTEYPFFGPPYIYCVMRRVKLRCNCVNQCLCYSSLVWGNERLRGSTGVWGLCPQRGREAEPLVRESWAEAPSIRELFFKQIAVFSFIQTRCGNRVNYPNPGHNSYMLKLTCEML